MRTRWLIIDGYSLLHRMEAPRGRARGVGETARQRLIRRIEELTGNLADRVTIVFDGTGEKTSAQEAAAVEVLFSPGDKTADTVIERLVHESPDAAGILVVTSDRAERDTVSASGAQSMSCGDFLALCDHERIGLAHAAGATRRKGPKPTLGDFFPKP